MVKRQKSFREIFYWFSQTRRFSSLSNHLTQVFVVCRFVSWGCSCFLHATVRAPHTDFVVDRSQRSTRGAGCIWAGATGPRKLFRLEFHILFSFYFFMCSIFVFNFFMFYFLSSTFFCLFLLFFLNFCVKKFSPNFLSHNLLLNFFGS